MKKPKSCRKCKCELCVKLSPIIRRVRSKISGRLRKDFDALITHFYCEGEDGDVAKAKLAGEWPGWEWMKETIKEQQQLWGKVECGHEASVNVKHPNSSEIVRLRKLKVRQRTMLIAYSKVVNSIMHLNDEERRRVMKAANITCGEAPCDL